MRPVRSHKQTEKGHPFRWIVLGTLIFFLSLTVLGAVGLFGFYMQINRSLPSTQALKEYQPALVSTIYAADGTVIGEFSEERRFLVALEQMPPHLIRAFLAAEDERFYEHGGVDLPGIFRALLKNLQAGEIVQGGSTITQQVVKSLLLTPERSWIRKIKEAILAYRIDQTLTKDEVLYLYLNQIYFGSGAYGVEAAARTYFDKHVWQLDLAESALLAGLPKAPSRFSPHQNIPMARNRQRYVLQRMAEVGAITPEEAQAAYNQPLNIVEPRRWRMRDLGYFTEEVRRQVEVRFGREGLYRGGLQIHTTLDVRAQDIAERALDQGLRQLDKRHRRYRGVHLNISPEDRSAALEVLARNNGELVEGKIVGALVVEYDPQKKICRLDLGGTEALLPASGWEWTRLSEKRAARMFRAGDVVRVRLDKLTADKKWLTFLEQDPAVEGAFMAMDPRTGRVLCLVGGRDFASSQFNRATQAVRQPGSAFKPVIYAAALDKGYTEISILMDTPLVINDRSLRGLWRPANYDRKFWGPTPLRKALIHSRNVVTVKLLDDVGVDYAIDYARNLGITSPLTRTLSLALGASGVTLRELLTAYSPFANEGNRVEPYLIEKIVDRHGNILETHQVQATPAISPQTAYIMTDLLRGVVEEGTARAARSLERPAAGKTGTTNEMRDAWFIGYTPEILAGVWVGYDDHGASLGKGETGGRAACPIWVSFMKEMLAGQPVQGFPIPDGIVLARIDPNTGALVSSEDPAAVYAPFAGEVPAARVRKPAEDLEHYLGQGGGTPSESFFKSDLF